MLPKCHDTSECLFLGYTLSDMKILHRFRFLLDSYTWSSLSDIDLSLLWLPVGCTLEDFLEGTRIPPVIAPVRDVASELLDTAFMPREEVPLPLAAGKSTFKSSSLFVMLDSSPNE